jgi:copper(I)-binding protein
MLRPIVRPIVLASMLCVLATTGHAQAPTAGPIAVENAWARATPGASTTGAAYLTVTDHGSAPDRLIGVTSPVAARAELHTMSNDNGVMTMRGIDGLAVEPGKPVELKPGGNHIMLFDLKQPLHEGDSFPLTLTFEKAGAVQVTVTVEKIGAMGPMPMPGMKPGMKM